MHTNFILSDIMEVLNEGFNAASCLSPSMSSIPVVEYLLQSIFLKATGYQEQKLKCIAWQLATHDYAFRYEYLSSRFNIGECSSIDDKTKVLSSLINQTQKIGEISLILSDDEIKDIIDGLRKDFKEIVERSPFPLWLPGDYKRFNDFASQIKPIENGYMKGAIFGGDSVLCDAYQSAFEHRNRCAHNLRSYQTNVPALKLLQKDEKGYENYFAHLFILVMVDKVFTEYYRYYQKFI